MLRATVILIVLTMLTSLGLASTKVSADSRVKEVRKAIVIDSNGKRIGTTLGDHHYATNVQVVIGLVVGGDEYILHVRPTNLTGPGDAMVLYESNDCSGQGYIPVDAFNSLSSISMVGTVPTIASKDPVNDPTNETLWKADTFSSSMKDINSTWLTDAADENEIVTSPICEAGGFGVLEVFSLKEVFDLSSQFTPPYSLRLQ